MENAERIALLERSNRRMKAGMAGLVALIVGLAILGVAAPTPKVLTAERFVLVDESGRERAELSSNTKASALQFLNSNGTDALVLTAGSGDNGVILSDKNGEDRLGFIASSDGTVDLSFYRDHGKQETLKITDNPEGTAISVRDSTGKDRINLGYSSKGAGLGVADRNGTVRSVIGEQGYATFDKNGKVDWTSFGENMTPEERKQVMDLVNSAPQP